MAAFGRIFKNSRGSTKGCFSRPLAEGFAFEAEIQVIIVGVSFSWEKGWKFLWIESDSSFLVSLLKNMSIHVPWQLKAR